MGLELRSQKVRREVNTVNRNKRGATTGGNVVTNVRVTGKEESPDTTLVLWPQTTALAM